MPFPLVGQTLYGGWTQEGEQYSDLKTRFSAFNSKLSGALGDSVTDDRAALNTVLNATMQPNGGQLDIAGVVRIGSALNVPANVRLNFLAGAYLAPDAGVTVTINGSFNLQMEKKFGGGGTIVLGTGSKMPYAAPPWWGADPSALAATNIAAFKSAQSAIPNGGVIFVPAGNYDMTSSTAAGMFKINTSKITLIGEGDATVLTTTKDATFTYAGELIAVVAVGNDVNNIADITLRDFKIQGVTPHTGAVIPAAAPQLQNGICINLSANGFRVDRLTMTGVKVTSVPGVAYMISGGSVANGGTYDTLVSGCWAFDTRNDGFNIIGGNVFDTKMVNNYAYDCDGFGFELAGAGMLVGFNTIVRTGQSAIGCETNVTFGATYRTVILGNTIKDIGTIGYPDAQGISLGQSNAPVNVDVRHNSIVRCGGHGIVAGPGGGNDIVIELNTIKDIGKNNVQRQGITFTSPTNLIVRHNTIRTTTAGYHMDNGVQIAGTGDDTNVIGPNEVVGAALVKQSTGNSKRIIHSLRKIISLTAAANVGAGETDLFSLAIPALTLDVDGMCYIVRAWGSTAANATGKRLRLYFGGGVCIDSTALAANNVNWSIDAIVGRRSNTVGFQKCSMKHNNTIIESGADIGGQNFTTLATILKITGLGGVNGDVTMIGWTVEPYDGIT